MKLGIEKLKVAVKFVIELAEAIEKKADDGKISWIEGLTLIPKLKDVPFIISNAGAIKDEFNDLDEFEKQELIDFIKSELDLENDKLESFIESCFDAIIGLSKVVEDIQILRSNEPGAGPNEEDPDP